MGLIAIILVIGIVIVILIKKNQDYKFNKDYSNSLTYRILTIVIIFLAIIQAPFFYYYTFGLFTFFVVIPYLLFSLTLTLILVYPLIKGKKTTKFHKYGTIFSMLIGTTTLIFGSNYIEKLDWNLRLKERELIIEKIINGEIKDSKLKMNNFPPISNGGNEILIDYKPDLSLTVTFFIDRGFINYYSAFIYTTDTAKIKTFDKKTKSERNKTNKKMKENWYRIAE